MNLHLAGSHGVTKEYPDGGHDLAAQQVSLEELQPLEERWLPGSSLIRIYFNNHGDDGYTLQINPSTRLWIQHFERSCHICLVRNPFLH